MGKELSEAAKTAKAIKLELKRHWPDISFSVKSENYSMGNSVRASWTFGPTRRQVERITKKYQHGHFDGMTDCYEYSPTSTPVSAKYVFAERDYPHETLKQIQKDYAAALGLVWQEPTWQVRFGDRDIQQLTYELLDAYELPTGYQGIVKTNKTGAGDLADFYALVGGKRIERYL